MRNPFIHLHLHSQYSISDSLIRIRQLLEKTYECGMPSVSVTDKNNLFSLVKFYRESINYGIKPILGVDIDIENSFNSKILPSVVLLCKNTTGYKNLTKLITEGYLNLPENNKFYVSKKLLQKYSDGLIALSGGINGDLSQAILTGKEENIENVINFWRKTYKDSFYLEITRTGRDLEDEYNSVCLDIAHKFNVPVVASNDVRFLKKEDFQAHEVRVCINEGSYVNDSKRKSIYSENQFFRNSDDIGELFSDIPSAVENTFEIAKRCSVSLPLGKVAMPNFMIDQSISEDEYFISKVKQALQSKLSERNILNKEHYYKRLDLETKVILDMGYQGYFLIVSDFVTWAKKNNIPVGPGRGSGAGSLVAYCLDITNIDPLEYDLLFERFLNPERISLPDFDIDFCMDRRDEVIEYVSKKYGKEKVSQIITYGTMTAKAVVRDVGRTLNFPYGFVDGIAKLIPFELGITLEKALEDKELKSAYQSDEDVKEIIDMSMILEGLPRNPGTHAGGVVISPTDLVDYTPLYRVSHDGPLLTQLDMNDLESMGLIKFDFLGLRTLTVIENTINLINKDKKHGEEFDIEQIGLHDEKTFSLLRSQKTTAVFQLESRGLQDIIKRLKPDKFDDLVALVALYRPGPLQSGMVDDFINRKNGAKIEYLHPLIEDILKPTYGVILYQEQVMQIAQVLAGYSLGAADILRRAMGKKKPEEMEKQREIFVNGSLKNGVDKNRAEHIFDLMEKFAGYGFNKSHSVAYALLAYQTAYLKTHFTEAFFAATLSSDMDNTDKIVRFINDCESLGVSIKRPSINASDYNFKVDGPSSIIYGLGAIKGAGYAAINNIIEARKENGNFSNLPSLLNTCDTQKVNKKVLESLIKSGSLDDFNETRLSLMNKLPGSMKTSEQNLKNISCGQQDIFGFSDIEANQEETSLKEWDSTEKLAYERDVLGFYLSGHPINKYKEEIKNLVSYNLNKLNKDFSNSRTKSKVIKIAGVITNLRVRNFSGGKIANITLSDDSDTLDVICSNELIKDKIKRDEVIILEGYVKFDDYTNRISFRANNIIPLGEARLLYATGINLKISGGEKSKRFLIESIDGFIKDDTAKANCSVRLEYSNNGNACFLTLPENYKIPAKDDIIEALEGIECVEDIQLLYGN